MESVRLVPKPDRRVEIALVLLALVVAIVGARPFVGGWNDGSRLATAECVGERGSLMIDDSVFVKVPPGDISPYPSDPPHLRTFGTLDKLSIGGHFYSDKPPVLGVLTGGLYRVWLALGGPTAAERPGVFCYALTLATSGLAYVIAVWCVVRLGSTIGLRGRTLFVFGLAFAAATMAPVYTRHVNGHAVLLGVAAGLCLVLARAGVFGAKRALIAGMLAGFGYTLDLGLGPGLLLATGMYMFAVGGWRAVAFLALGSVPWVAAHHALNYAIGGTFAPANTVPEYLTWPGSPFNAANMTGGLKHGALGFVQYAADLMIGRKGFLLHNPPLWLVPGGCVLLWLYRPAARPAVAFAVGWVQLGWLPYAATSTNWSGVCCSVRWFVPFLAPGFWVVGHTLREFPRYRPDFIWLTMTGAALAALMWWSGPWAEEPGIGLWSVVVVAGVGWGVIRHRDSPTESRVVKIWRVRIPVRPWWVTRGRSESRPRQKTKHR